MQGIHRKQAVSLTFKNGYILRCAEDVAFFNERISITAKITFFYSPIFPLTPMSFVKIVHPNAHMSHMGTSLPTTINFVGI